MKVTAEQAMSDLLEEIQVGEQAAREGQLSTDQLAWIEAAKAEVRRLEVRLTTDEPTTLYQETRRSE